MDAAQHTMEALMPRLTDTQLVILSAAAQREGGAALPLPKSLRIKGAALTKTLESLRRKGLLEEKPAPRGAAAWREDNDGRPMMLVITESGQQAIDGDPAGEPPKQPAPKKAPGKQSSAKRKPAGRGANGRKAAPPVRQGTKQALLIGLLKRKSGATIDEAVKATGWQAHSVRGAISGALKKKLGLTVTSESVDGRGRVYRIVEGG